MIMIYHRPVQHRSEAGFYHSYFHVLGTHIPPVLHVHVKLMAAPSTPVAGKVVFGIRIGAYDVIRMVAPGATAVPLCALHLLVTHRVTSPAAMQEFGFKVS